MDLSQIVSDIASGSAEATPVTGSAGVDAITGVPSQIIGVFANLLGELGS